MADLLLSLTLLGTAAYYAFRGDYEVSSDTNALRPRHDMSEFADFYTMSGVKPFQNVHKKKESADILERQVLPGNNFPGSNFIRRGKHASHGDELYQGVDLHDDTQHPLEGHTDSLQTDFVPPTQGGVIYFADHIVTLTENPVTREIDF